MCQICDEMKHRIEVVMQSNISDEDKRDLIDFLQYYWEDQIEHATQ